LPAEVVSMSEKHWIIADQDEQSVAREREREQRAEIRGSSVRSPKTIDAETR
jgi:hypothetical protein